MMSSTTFNMFDHKLHVLDPLLIYNSSKFSFSLLWDIWFVSFANKNRYSYFFNHIITIQENVQTFNFDNNFEYLIV